MNIKHDSYVQALYVNSNAIYMLTFINDSVKKK